MKRTLRNLPFLLALMILFNISSTAINPAPSRYEVAQNHPKASDDNPGTADMPWKTITKAAETVKPGDMVIIHEGAYRERVHIKTNGTSDQPIRFEAAPGERVVMTGADLITGWTKLPSDNPIYIVAWPHAFINNTRTGSMIHPSDEYHKMIGRAEQVIVNGYLLKQVLSVSQLSAGTFFADTDNKTLYVWDRTNRELTSRDLYTEASVRAEILRVEGAYVQVRGIQFRYAANFAQRGAVQLAGHHALLEDCIIEQMNACGISFRAPDMIVRRCYIRDNGQLGFGGSNAHRLLFTECTVENNNTKNYSRQWEAGGDKLAFCRGVIIEKSKFLRNRGTGIWFDIGNDSCVVRNCYVADNEASGLFYEISFRLYAHDNVFVGNGFAVDPGNWGVQAGISLSSSPGCVVERNILVGNKEGFAFREQYRTTPLIGDRKEIPVWNHDETIKNNIIAFNRDAQVYAWFNQRDERHLPSKTPGKMPVRMEEIKRNNEGQPVDLTLEDLNLKFINNFYFAYPNQGMVKWAPSFNKTHRSYATVPEFQNDLKIDAGGKTAEPVFYNLNARDFRISKKCMAMMKDCYPKGIIPGISLGTF